MAGRIPVMTCSFSRSFGSACAASPALLAPPPADSTARPAARSSAANAYAPAFTYSHRRTASAGPYRRASLAVASFTMAGAGPRVGRWAAM